MITPRVETSVDDSGRAVCDRLSTDVFHIVCPWHGWEFELATGRFAGDRTRRQRSYLAQQRGSAIYLVDREA
jgi:nitrite reductase/ring-hydroxylating ferredoxin subunit